MTGRNQILESLHSLFGAATGIDIVDMGLVKQILLKGDQIHIALTLPSPICPPGRYLPLIVRQKVKSVAGGKNVIVEVVDAPRQLQDHPCLSATTARTRIA